MLDGHVEKMSVGSGSSLYSNPTRPEVLKGGEKQRSGRLVVKGGPEEKSHCQVAITELSRGPTSASKGGKESELHVMGIHCHMCRCTFVYAGSITITWWSIDRRMWDLSHLPSGLVSSSILFLGVAYLLPEPTRLLQPPTHCSMTIGMSTCRQESYPIPTAIYDMWQTIIGYQSPTKMVKNNITLSWF